jgi:hypothetical protein
MTTYNFCFYLQNRLIITSQTGGQQYSDTSPFSIPWTNTLAYYEQSQIMIVKCFITLGPRMASRLRIFETISLSCGGSHKTFLNPSDGSERIEIGSDGSAHLLYWHWLKRAPLKRCHDLYKIVCHFATKKCVFMNILELWRKAGT